MAAGLLAVAGLLAAAGVGAAGLAAVRGLALLGLKPTGGVAGGAGLEGPGLRMLRARKGWAAAAAGARPWVCRRVRKRPMICSS